MMAMIQCSECNNQISDSATTCPHCGKPNGKVVPVQVGSRPVGVLLGLGIFIFPIIFSWFTLRKGHSSLARIISFVWLLLSFALIGANDSSKNAVSGTQQSTAVETPVSAPAKEEVITVGINSILDEYKGNEVAADNQYKGKLVQVSGVVDDIKKDITDSLYVTVGTGSEFEIPQIQAFFDDSMNAQLSKLHKGQRITIVCRIQGLMMNVLGKECVIE